MAAMAFAWPSVSEPALAVCASSTARLPSREIQAPSRSGTRWLLSSWPSTDVISPVGSRGNSVLVKSPAGEASRSKLSLTAAFSPSGEKRSGVTVGLSR